jgi:hypothetical protein
MAHLGDLVSVLDLVKNAKEKQEHNMQDGAG